MTTPVTTLLEQYSYRSPAELAVACQQWIEIGSVYQSSYFAKRAYQLARELQPHTLRKIWGW